MKSHQDWKETITVSQSQAITDKQSAEQRKLSPSTGIELGAPDKPASGEICDMIDCSDED